MKKICSFLVILHLIVAIDCEIEMSDSRGPRNPEDQSSVSNNNVSESDGHSATLSGTTDDANSSDCPDNVECNKLSGDCLLCPLNYSCIYGEQLKTKCSPKRSVICTGEQIVDRNYKCQYCYQTERWQQVCSNSTDCKVVTAPLQRYMANCSVSHDVICLGKRKFNRMLPCNWTSGKRWSTALILSITLGGFGADRFYLGHWRAGIGKLFSFGGLGVWTIVDVILVASGYVGPADYSLYIF